MDFTASADNAPSTLSFNEEVTLIPALQSGGELRLAASNHRVNAQLATEEAERALGGALFDGDESGGEAYPLFLLAEAHEDAATRLDAAAALLDEALALVERPFSPDNAHRVRSAQEAFNNASSPDEAHEAALALEEALGAP